MNLFVICVLLHLCFFSDNAIHSEEYGGNEATPYEKILKQVGETEKSKIFDLQGGKFKVKFYHRPGSKSLGLSFYRKSEKKVIELD